MVMVVVRIRVRLGCVEIRVERKYINIGVHTVNVSV